MKSLQRVRKFDPFQHLAVMVENHDEYEDGKITEELPKGYRPQ